MANKKTWKPEDVLKGKMAETLVNELLRKKECGNKVYRFGYEAVLQNLTQLEQNFNRYTPTSEIIRSIPDFVVVNLEGRPFFVEVKYKPDKKFKKDEWDKLRDTLNYWNAILIIVSSKTKPFFQAAYTLNGRNFEFMPIEDFREFNVAPGALAEFNRLVEIYYKSERQK